VKQLGGSATHDSPPGDQNQDGNTSEPGSVSVVVPVYNGRATVDELVRRVDSVLGETGIVYEMILVNDGSQDNSWQSIVKLAECYPSVKGLDLMRNYGQHNALLAGILAAQHEIVVTMDDDLQHRPENIPTLLDKLREGHDVVYGIPYEQRHGVLRDLASLITKAALQTVMRADTARNISAFRAFRTRVRDAFADYQGPFVSIDVLLTWGTVRFAAVPVRHEVRRTGASSYTFRRLVAHAVNMVTGFSTLPLRVASLIGFSFTIVGLVLLAFVLSSYVVYGGSIPGFAFLASVITIFSGAQLFSLGMIGEYLSRVHFRTMGQPYCVIRDTTGFSHLGCKNRR